MELEELKSAWVALDNRLKEDDSLKETIILEIIERKTNRFINRLLNYEIFSISILIVMIPCIVLGLDRFGGKAWLWDTLMIAVVIMLVIGSVWFFYKIHGLMKVNLSKDVSNNIYYVNSYNIQIKRERVVLECIILPALFIGAIFLYAEAKAGIALWTFLICTFTLAAIIGHWTYKRLYGRNINSILKSLNELKELKEKEAQDLI